MQLIPAIDLKDGQCVRLRQGRFDEVTVFSADPVAQAEDWLNQGARRLHLVDLDGARAGTPQNTAAIRAIRARTPELPVQVGGGIRSAETVAQYLALGVTQVVVGTMAVEDPDRFAALCAQFPGRIIAGIDVRDGRAATAGWESTSEHLASDLGRAVADAGAAAIIFTDIQRDGMMGGVNAEATAALARATGLPIYASGGVSSLADVRALAPTHASGVAGAIVGRALYEGRLCLAEAQVLLDELTGGDVVGAGGSGSA